MEPNPTPTQQALVEVAFHPLIWPNLAQQSPNISPQHDPNKLQNEPQHRYVRVGVQNPGPNWTILDHMKSDLIARLLAFDSKPKTAQPQARGWTAKTKLSFSSNVLC